MKEHVRKSDQPQPGKDSSRLAARPLRLSCDACGAAKVKCSKDRPRCGRCDSMDLDCVYSTSLRYGRPQRKRSDQLGQANGKYTARKNASHQTPNHNPRQSNSHAFNTKMNHNTSSIEPALNQYDMQAGLSKHLLGSAFTFDQPTTSQPSYSSYQAPYSALDTSMDGMTARSRSISSPMSNFSHSYSSSTDWSSGSTTTTDSSTMNFDYASPLRG